MQTLIRSNSISKSIRLTQRKSSYIYSSTLSGSLTNHINRLYSSKSDNPVTLYGRNATIHLLGTMHIAQASAVAARGLIEKENAKGTLGRVFLELDERRFHRLKTTTKSADESLLIHALSILSRAHQTPLQGLIEVGMSSLYRVLHRLGFASGIEFQAAIKTCDYLNIPITLGDQEIEITMRKLAQAIPKDFDMKRLMNLMFSPSTQSRVSPAVEERIREAFQAISVGNIADGQERLSKLLNRDTVRHLTRHMEETAPNIAKTVLDERDIVMTDNLLKATAVLPGEKRIIVAIVGLAHVEGISKRWNAAINHEATGK